MGMASVVPQKPTKLNGLYRLRKNSLWKGFSMLCNKGTARGALWVAGQ